MSAGAKLGAYGLVLAAAVGGGAGLGTAVGPVDVRSDEEHHADHGPIADTSSPPADVGGLPISDDGYRLVPEDRLADAGPFAFTIVDHDGSPVHDFAEVHGRELHLLVAGRDLQDFTHVHPTRDPRGRWSVDLPTMPAGAYRAFADFRPTGARTLTLGVDLVVPGVVAEPAPLVDRRAVDLDGFDVVLDGDLHPGAEAELTVTVRKAGAVVTTDPYLEAAGHLVALRDGDLAYLHVHPLDEAPNGPVRFAVDAPSAGTYGLFFDFVVDGQLRTARFVVTTAGGPAAPTTATTAPPAGHGGGHDH